MPGHDLDLVDGPAFRRKSTVSTQQDQGRTAVTQRVVAGTRGIDYAPALLLALTDLQGGQHLAIHQQYATLPAEQVTESAAGLRLLQLPFCIQTHVGKQQDQFITKRGGLSGVVDHERTVKPVADLRG